MAATLNNILAALLLPAIGTIALIFLIRRGFLRPKSLADAPIRRVSIPPLVLLWGLFLFLLGSAAAISLAQTLGLLSHDPIIQAAATSPAASASQPATVPASAPATAPASPDQLNEAWSTAWFVLLAQTVSQCPVVLLLLIWVGRQPNGQRELGIIPRHWREEIAEGVTCLVAAVPLVLSVIFVVSFIAENWFHLVSPEVAHELLLAMRKSNAPGATAVMIASAVLVAPILEEIIFRGLLQTGLLQAFGPTSRGSIVTISALIFASVHVGAGSWQMLPGLFILGLVLGWLYERTGSLLPSIVLHAGFNAVNTVLAFQVAVHI